jgi:hypothetical protein
MEQGAKRYEERGKRYEKIRRVVKSEKEKSERTLLIPLS